MGARAQMGPLKEELEVELPLEEDNEEDEEVLFIFGNMKRSRSGNYLQKMRELKIKGTILF